MFRSRKGLKATATFAKLRFSKLPDHQSRGPIVTDNKSFKPGCGTYVIASLFIGCVVVALSWNVPVTKTDKGEPVLVQDFVRAFADHQPDTAQKDTKASSSGKDKIDAELFGVMEPGVTRQETVQSLLDQGELVSSAGAGPYRTELYRIDNSDGSRATLAFQNGVLISKAQEGLN